MADWIDIGANASAEEASEDLEEGQVTVNNIVHSFRLNSTQFAKKDYTTHLKGMFPHPSPASSANVSPGYMKKVKAKLLENGKSAEEVDDFQKRAAAAAKKLFANFNDYEFFMGESMDLDGMIALLNYRDDGVTPYMIFWKDGLVEMKV